MHKQNKKVVVAMSGGVDSSAAAFLLKKQGYEVIGIFMRLGIDGEDGEAAARQVCQKLNIKFYPINLTQEFKKEVMDYFLNSYARGLTPNPCVKCNQFIKFNGLLKLAEKLGADYLATGHYARLRREIPNSKFQIPNPPACLADRQVGRGKLQNIHLMPSCHSRESGNPGDSGRKVNNRLKVINIPTALTWIPNQVGNDNAVFKLFRGKDREKDQSYFLYNLTQEQLARVLFPLGDYTKAEVRKIADRAKLPYLKKESQDICFLKGDHNDFLRKHLKLKPGPIKVLLPLAKGEIERGSKTIGEHQGLPLYTIGQRRGVEIGGIGPFYVAKCDYKTNTLYVASNGNDPMLYSDKLTAEDVNWIAGQEPKMPLKCEAVIRYRHKPVKCEISAQGGYKYSVKFSKPQRAITPGQSIVFYQGDEVLGGGVIR